MSQNKSTLSSNTNSNIERFLVKNRGVDVTPSREQGPSKRSTKWSDVVARKTKVPDTQETSPNLSDPPVIPCAREKETMILNEEGLLKNIQEKERKQETESEDESEDELVASFPHHDDAFKSEHCMSHRFILNMEIDVTNDPKTFLKKTVVCINKTLSSMQKYLHFHGVPGKIALIPWDYTQVFTNRVIYRLKSSVGHEALLLQIRTLLWNYGGPFGKKSETTAVKKYCRINVAIVHEDLL
jgi:hypothetical protein